MTDSTEQAGDMISRIRKHIEDEAGLLVEAQAASIGWADGWWVAQNSPYEDPETGVLREADVALNKILLADEARPRHQFQSIGTPGDGTPEVKVFIECSRSRRHPWVFHRETAAEAGSYMQPGTFARNFVAPGFDFTTEAVWQHFWLGDAPPSRTWTVAFSKKDDIFDAVMKALKATYASVADRVTRRYTPLSDPELLFPVVLLDGKLASASLDGEDLVITEESRMTMLVSHQLDRPSRFEIAATVIEVCTLESLPAVLSDIVSFGRKMWAEAATGA